MSYTIKVTPSGAWHFIYQERLKPLLGRGHAVMTRASYVNPQSDGSWTADLTPLKGPVLANFPTRQHALDAEEHWITHHWIEYTAPDDPPPASSQYD